MKRTAIFLLIAVILIAAIALIAVKNIGKAQLDNTTDEGVFTSADKESINPNANPEVSTPETPSSENSATYTLAEVSAHKDASSCWTVIRTGVYDLTSWIKAHPGGQKAILNICGKDGTAAFVAQHGGQSQQENILKSFLIGTYKNE